MDSFAKCTRFGALAAVAGFFWAMPAWSIDVQVANAPDSDLALTVNTIQSAQKSIVLNMYELSSPDIADALENRIQAGVQVQILEEGQPVGGMSTASQGIVSQLVSAMENASAGDHLYEMTSKAGGKRRFRYDHAKYAVIDGTSLLIGSENYSPTGNPEVGSLGNRGWEVVVQNNASLAQQFSQMFASDSDTSNGDVLEMTGSKKSAFNPFGSSPVTAAPDSVSPPSGGTLSATAVDRFNSPDTSLTGLTALFQSATQSIDIELMTFDPAWGKAAQNPLIQVLLDAAQRGVKVRVLLNDESVFDSGTGNNNPFSNYVSKPKNPVTLQLLNAGADKGWPIQAVIADVKAMGVDYIHNKGAIVDGNKTLISSINWDLTSIQKNREAAVVITSSAVFNYYEALFQSDWNASQGSAPTPLLDAAQKSAACPSGVDVDVRIGKLDLQGMGDESFADLSGKHFSVSLNRDPNSDACLFVSDDSSREKSQVTFEIRETASGDTLYILEGFTDDGNVYSIRSKKYSGSETELSASVYDGSGLRKKLGTATMTLESQTND